MIRAAENKIEHKTKPNYTTSNKVNIGKNFYGYIRALKYFKKGTPFYDPIDYFNEN